jgi:hypothetical protein
MKNPWQIDKGKAKVGKMPKICCFPFDLFHERANVGISALVFPLFWGFASLFLQKINSRFWLQLTTSFRKDM